MLKQQYSWIQEWKNYQAYPEFSELEELWDKIVNLSESTMDKYAPDERINEYFNQAFRNKLLENYDNSEKHHIKSWWITALRHELVQWKWYEKKLQESINKSQKHLKKVISHNAKTWDMTDEY